MPRLSPSPRRAWIEIKKSCAYVFFECCRPPHGGRGLKCKHAGQSPQGLPSPSPRRAWIEIIHLKCIKDMILSRPPHGGRGLKSQSCTPLLLPAQCRPPLGGRGLKYKDLDYFKGRTLSPSPRRAWIEMRDSVIVCKDKRVALPTEGVD